MFAFYWFSNSKLGSKNHSSFSVVHAVHGLVLVVRDDRISKPFPVGNPKLPRPGLSSKPNQDFKAKTADFLPNFCAEPLTQKRNFPENCFNRNRSFQLYHNGHVYETFGISKHFPVKLQLLLIRVEMLHNALTAKCFIYDVVRWWLFIILLIFFSFHSFIKSFLSLILFFIPVSLVPKNNRNNRKRK